LLKLFSHGAQKESQNSPFVGDQSVAHFCSCFVALYTYYSTTGLFGQIIEKPAEAGSGWFDNKVFPTLSLPQAAREYTLSFAFTRFA
jgi:hypothetical protein